MMGATKESSNTSEDRGQEKELLTMGSISDKEDDHCFDKVRELYPINAWDDIEYADVPYPVPCWERCGRATVLSIDPTNNNSDILDTTKNECIPNGHLIRKIGTLE